jgi:hypothetical protein
MKNPFNIDWGTFVFRCSELGHITSVGRGAVLTDNQRVELDDLLAKIKLTDKQAERRDVLIAKRDAPPQLSEGAKTYLKQRFLEVITGRTKYIETKFTEKGTIVEHDAICLANDVLGWELPLDYIASLEFTKQRLTNDYITGEMDVNHPDILADVKAPWNIHTFPFFDTNIPTMDYYWQLQGYMMLTGHTEAELVYVLVDTPMHLINDEIRRREWKKGYIEMPDDEAESIRRELTFDDLPSRMKVRRWNVTRNDEAFQTIKQSVILAREYFRELALQFESMYQVKIKIK